ncbi:hypothetical protein FHS85_003467 [Rhodoligotrophos appendicifer]|uniref:Dabb family protein n=1 Tax=Rhodoligotrophos appendicifer TaxID=987056 RepID=UPI001184CDB9|nr:Dabb family protein [Rhodoligotrophos appendicifer]
MRPYLAGLLSGLLVGLTACSEVAETPPVRHVVLAKIKTDTPQSAIDRVFQDLRDLEQVVPGLRHFQAGANVSPEGKTQGYTHGFTIDFNTDRSRDAYLRYPDHISAAKELIALTEGGEAGILVFDFPMR